MAVIYDGDGVILWVNLMGFNFLVCWSMMCENVIIESIRDAFML